MKEPFAKLPTPSPYLLAVVLPLLALGISIAFKDLFALSPFLLFFVAIVITTAYGGLAPGGVAVVVSLAAVAFFMNRLQGVTEVTGTTIIRLLMFLAVAAFLAWLHARMNRAQRQSQKTLLELEEAHHKTTDVLESISDAFYAVDSGWRFTYVNQRARTLWHKENDQLIGEPIWSIFPQAVETEPYMQQQATMRDRRPRHFETMSPVVQRWITVSVYPTGNGISVYFRDVTEQKMHQRNSDFLVRAGETLASSLDYETTLRAVAKLAMPTIADWCAVDLLTPERTMRRLIVAHIDPEKVAWGYEQRARNPVDLSAPTGVAAVLRTGQTEFYPNVDDELLEASAATEADLAMLRRIGLRSLIITPLAARGRILGSLTLATTVDSGRTYHEDDLKLAIALAQRAGLAVDNAQLYAEAQQQREQLLVTLTSIGDAVIATDAQTRVRFINPVAEALTGWSAADADGRYLAEVFEIINEQTRQPVESPAAKVLREGNIAGLANHTILISRDGRETPIDDSGAPIRNADGEMTGVVLVFRDITERHAIERTRAELLLQEQNARRAAEAANELKLKFLAMVSHELRTPLASIKGFTSTLLANDVAWDTGTQHEFITIMDVEADRLTELVEQLLDISRLQAGSLRIEITPQAVQDVVTIAMPQLRALTDSHRLIFEIPEALPDVLMDKQRISQVLVNLVANAVKFSPTGTQITVSAKAMEGEVRFDIADEGEGIAPEEQKLVFDAFQQGMRQGARKPGAGLGLAICKGIVETHHGRIWIADHAGPGTTISFTLPTVK